MKNWDNLKGTFVDTPKDVEEFIDKIKHISKEYGYSISYEDSYENSHGGFIIESYSESNIEWLKSASLSVSSK